METPKQSDAAEATGTAVQAKDVAHASQDVNPWSVSGAVVDGKIQAIDYNNLVDSFGTQLITGDLLQRFKDVTGHEPHIYMRRGLFFSHRDLNLILDLHAAGKPFFLYTGRGPSSANMHLGHMIPFTFTKWLQDVFDVPLVIMMTDDEKVIFQKINLDRKDSCSPYTDEEMDGFVKQNALDILSVGFDLKKTFLFSDFEFMGGAFYRNVVKISRLITLNQSKAVFGFNDSDSVGKAHFVSVQTATAFATSFPHIFGTNTEEVAKIPALIPCAIDQDPYFRVCRDVAHRLKYQKPALIHAKFFPALQGPGSKMSASDANSAIFMSDDMNTIKKKINKHAFSGGAATAEEQRQFGGNPDVDVAFQYLRFFLEDDKELKRIEDAYRKGELLTGELKKICIQQLQAFVGDFQKRRALLDSSGGGGGEDGRKKKGISEQGAQVVRDFMQVRPLIWRGKEVDAAGGEEGETREVTL
ncbi:tryptophanyl-tRNA synthetase [Pseudovirgaria hyperparasitica]|uniref:Tryptophan--tRNA ligase, cytoplasmic n=1 Tax=Pseudovirgaria hyperparasitica TaxID=470096 RepID=A0A6A6WAC1_9PEZI|nr:tryptophanyl-tRNA synthetase [Pseudovirgaria hyperparasitica]KAF2758984.1 tryptophanyl-tRNA synthetase [Pseudovirgaria hyperparasitica]